MERANPRAGGGLPESRAERGTPDTKRPDQSTLDAGRREPPGSRAALSKPTPERRRRPFTAPPAEPDAVRAEEPTKIRPPVPPRRGEAARNAADEPTKVRPPIRRGNGARKPGSLRPRHEDNVLEPGSLHPRDDDARKPGSVRPRDEEEAPRPRGLRSRHDGDAPKPGSLRPRHEAAPKPGEPRHDEAGRPPGRREPRRPAPPADPASLKDRGSDPARRTDKPQDPPTVKALEVPKDTESDGPNRRADGVDAATYLLTPVTEPDGEAKPAEPKPLTRKRPAKPTAAQTTVMQRLWRNEPTVLIPAISDKDQPPPKPSEPAPNTRLQQKRERKDRRALVAGKAAVATLAALIFLAAGGAWGMKEWYDSKFTEVAALDEESKDIKHKAAQVGDENFLILGSDSRVGAPKGAGIGTEKTIKGARSDTLMIAHLPKDRSRAILVSFPRDLEITRPECYRWNYKTGEYSNEKIPETPQVKLNTAYAEGGPRCVIKWVQKTTGMKMTRFVGIDFAGFKEMVDAVGGVQIKVDTPIVDSILGTVVDKPGVTTLTGDRALSFVRARHVEGDPTSDYGRIKRQQQFIAALLTKTMSRDVLLDPQKLTSFVNAFAAATFGDNIGVDELLDLAQSLKGMDTDSVSFLTVPTTGYANERGNEVMLEDEAAELFSAIIHDKPIPGLDDDKDASQDKPDERASDGEGDTSAQSQQVEPAGTP